jgi:hypothetical protein
VVLLQNSMDCIKHEPDLCNESCPAVCDESQATNVKVEDLLDVEGQEDHVPVGVASVNVEREVSLCVCVCVCVCVSI